MSNIRLIARLDIKAPNLIKGINLEGVRVIGDPQEHALRYYEAGLDEIIYMDVVASLYGRNHLTDIIRTTTKDVFVPITVGGGVRSVEDVEDLLKAGADKVAINTAATKNPRLITDVARKFGSQCMVLSIEAKHNGDHWEAYVDNGREQTGLNVVDWAQHAVELGAGEILLTSVDREGTRSGFDIALSRAVSTSVPIPVIVSGGMGSIQDLVDVVSDGCADAVAMADVLHYQRIGIPEIRQAAIDAGIHVRKA